MGAYTELYVAGYPFYSTKSLADPAVMTIFRKMDKKVYKRMISENYRYQWIELEDDVLDETEIAYEYSNTVPNIKQRLDLLGFSLGQSKLDFQTSLKSRIDEITSMINYSSNSKFGKEIVQSYKKELELLNDCQYEDWQTAFEQIINGGLRRTDQLLGIDKDALTYYVLDAYPEDVEYRYPCSDIRFLLRTVLEVCPDDKMVVQDITDLVQGGYYEPDDLVCEISLQFFTGDYPVAARIIVLTEGSSDKAVLEKSLALLYPHLVDYYSFMDFGISNSSGGASALVETIKSFIGSGISNRIVAIFDNDTAAHVARRNLAKTQIPSNIKILEYPHLIFAESYPTVGPNGLADANINGLACSIECYFGSDIITQNGGFVPVQWKGYNDSLNQYQGEILHKKELQNAFFDKVSRCQNDNTEILRTDWEPIKLILNEIFYVFLANRHFKN